MNCERCGAALDAETLLCPACGAKHTLVCSRCGAAMAPGAACPHCGGQGLPGLDMSRAEMEAAGMRCFMPYPMERNYDIYLGGNHDGGGYVFHNMVGYTGPSLPRIVLPSLVEGRPIYGIWNEFFCLGDEFTPETYEATFRRMMPIREIVVAHGIREVFTYAFFGCSGLETLVLPRSLKKMFYDFYDLFTDGEEPMRNGVKKSPVTIRYRGSQAEWAQVALTSRFWDYVEKGCIIMEYLDN